MGKLAKMGGAVMVSALLSAVLIRPAAAETLEELSRRVTALEQAVKALQETCGKDRAVVKTRTERVPPGDVWTCRVTGRKKTFYGSGRSKGLAERDAMEQCQPEGGVCEVKECSKD